MSSSQLVVFLFFTEQSEGRQRRTASGLLHCRLVNWLVLVLLCCICTRHGLSFRFSSLFQLPFCHGRLLFDSPWKQFYGNHILWIRRTGSHGGAGGGHSSCWRLRARPCPYLHNVQCVCVKARRRVPLLSRDWGSCRQAPGDLLCPLVRSKAWKDPWENSARPQGWGPHRRGA